MVCPKCSSDRVNVQVVNKGSVKSNSFVRKLLILSTCGLWILVPKRKRTKAINEKQALCQNCGYSWRI